MLALQEYGRLVEIICILRYLDDESMRRRIGIQINKDELRRRRADEQMSQAGCQNLVTNAVILWNTAYMAAALDQLRLAGDEHIKLYGKFSFDFAPASRTGLRPLRKL